MINSMDERVENSPRRILDLLSTQPDSATIARQVLATVSQLPGRPRQSSELGDPQRYSKIFRYLLTTPIFPTWGRPTGPDNAGVTTRLDSWRWICYEVRDKVDRSDWQHVEFIDEIHPILMGVLREIAHCEYPPVRSPSCGWGPYSPASCGGLASYGASRLDFGPST